MQRNSTAAATLAVTVILAGIFAPDVASAAARPSCHGHRATIVGTDGKDKLTGTPGRDVIVGRGGPDRIHGKAGDDLVCGGAGRDILAGGHGDDLLDGQLDGRYWDEGWFYVPDVLGGGPGNDRIIGGDSHAGDQATFINAAHGVRVDTGKGKATGQGKDRLVGITSVAGSDHADTIRVRGGDDITSGRGGNDSITASRYALRLTAGPGDDRIRLAGGGAASGDGGNDRLDADGKRWSDLDGGDGNDVIDGGKGADSAYTGKGADVVRLRQGADSVEEGTGDDRLYGGPGNDYLANDRGAARITGGEGNDTLFGGRDDDTLRGGPGSDTAKYLMYEVPKPVTVDLAKGKASGGQGDDLIRGTENIMGSPYNDVLRGDSGPNYVEPDGGEDVIRTFGGDDRIRTSFATIDAATGAGDDTIEFSYRDDSVRGNNFDGGAGADTFDLRRSSLGGEDPAGLVVDLGQGFVRARGTADLLGFESVVGNRSASTIIGTDGPNRLIGGSDRDVLEGAGGDDHLDGIAGRDNGDGGDGTDTCVRIETVTACEQ